MYVYEPQGTCAAEIQFDIQDGKMHKVRFEGGCNGNLKALGILVEGMDAQSCATKLKGIRCGFRSTSCGDQFARAIEQALEPKE
ncbi:MAG: TIGR03905 family TSCPD domain-containing protein [Spirochaetaceae bacterium]|jgi:uncharacterized protein (TIGR03905 family)|nr:TIGR03905 family TSCPD domain-containing protein [Spirochaetaceae bacterium]